MPTERSVFTLCTRGLHDPAFPKYPQLPVLRCRGYDPIADAPAQDEPEGR